MRDTAPKKRPTATSDPTTVDQAESRTLVRGFAPVVEATYLRPHAPENSAGTAGALLLEILHRPGDVMEPDTGA